MTDEEKTPDQIFDPREDDSTASVSPARDSNIGRTIGQYSVKEILGSGGMGTLYLAVQEKPRRTVALLPGICRHLRGRIALVTERGEAEEHLVFGLQTKVHGLGRIWIARILRRFASIDLILTASEKLESLSQEFDRLQQQWYRPL